MTDESPTPRRRRPEPESPELPSGYRSSRRGSRAAKRARKAVKAHEVRENISASARTAGGAAATAARRVLLGLGGIAAVFLALLVLASVVNGVARWNARRTAEKDRSPAATAEAARDNLLVIGVSGDDATGFIALKVEPKEKRAWGIAIPGGAFMEVPGQGFERVSESYKMGAAVSEATVSNYLTVPFNRHLVVDDAVYRAALEAQNVSQLVDEAKSTDLSASEQQRLRTVLKSVAARDVGLVSLPVTPISIGDQTYFEPQRDKVADLLKTWWGVELSAESQPTRVLVYNGSGTPGIAGKVAQALIRRGLRVVETRNADRFDYKTSEIIVQHGGQAVGTKVKQALGGVGTITLRESSQQVVDVIIIVGKDYAPSETDG